LDKRNDLRYGAPMIATLVLLCACLATTLTGAEKAMPASLYEISAKSLEGKPQPLSAYKGKVALVVNVASECGATPQYSGLQKLYADNKDKGFVVLGFPSNDFGGQEPGSAEQISSFCTKNYGVTFPMFEKVTIKSGAPHPVYSFLAAKHDAPGWNFHKYLVGKDGKVIQSFAADVEPSDEQLQEAIKKALK
jgi:glutathione peroxidase